MSTTNRYDEVSSNGVCPRCDPSNRRCYSISNGQTEERISGSRCSCIDEAGNPLKSMMSYCFGNPNKTMSKVTRNKLEKSLA